jgi:hypothetical protein
VVQSVAGRQKNRDRFPVVTELPPPIRCVQTGSGAHLDFYPVRIAALYPGIKLLEREAGHSPPVSRLRMSGVIPRLVHMC